MTNYFHKWLALTGAQVEARVKHLHRQVVLAVEYGTITPKQRAAVSSELKDLLVFMDTLSKSAQRLRSE